MPKKPVHPDRQRSTLSSTAAVCEPPLLRFCVLGREGSQCVKERMHNFHISHRSCLSRLSSVPPLKCILKLHCKLTLQSLRLLLQVSNQSVGGGGCREHRSASSQSGWWGSSTSAYNLNLEHFCVHVFVPVCQRCFQYILVCTLISACLFLYQNQHIYNCFKTRLCIYGRKDWCCK